MLSDGAWHRKIAGKAGPRHQAGGLARSGSSVACASWAEPIADSSPIGLLSRDLSQSYKCVDCDETPRKGQYFHLVETNETAMVQREFLADYFAC